MKDFNSRDATRVFKKKFQNELKKYLTSNLSNLLQHSLKKLISESAVYDLKELLFRGQRKINDMNNIEEAKINGFQQMCLMGLSDIGVGLGTGAAAAAISASMAFVTIGEATSLTFGVGSALAAVEAASATGLTATFSVLSLGAVAGIGFLVAGVAVAISLFDWEREEVIIETANNCYTYLLEQESIFMLFYAVLRASLDMREEFLTHYSIYGV